MSGLRVLALVVVLHCKLFVTRLGGSFGSSNGIALIARPIIYNLPGFLSGEVQNCVAKAICIVDGSQIVRANRLLAPICFPQREEEDKEQMG